MFEKVKSILSRRLCKDEAFKNNVTYLSVNVFSTKVLIEDTIFMSPTGDGTTCTDLYSSHTKV